VKSTCINPAGSALALCTVLLGLGQTGTEELAAAVSRQSKAAELGEIQIIAIFLKQSYKKVRDH